MISRKDKFKKDNTKGTKLLIGTLILTVGIGSSINVAFADQDIQAMLNGWFDKQKTKSVETIEKAVMSEKEIQMQRLKEELQIEIKSAEQQLNQFTEEEKEKRVNALKVHTDELIKNLQIDNSEEQEAIVSELNQISQEAMSKMEEAIKTETKDEESSEVIEESTEGASEGEKAATDGNE